MYPYLPLPVTEYLEWLNLFLLCIPGHGFRVDHTGSDGLALDLWDPGDDVRILAGVVFRVSAIDVDIPILQNMNLSTRENKIT